MDAYTPSSHPLVPNASLRARIQHFDGAWRPTPFVRAYEHLSRRFPVEERFWASAAAPIPCTSQHTIRLGSALCAPKFFCGTPTALSKHLFAAWSIGSAGETCFEEFLHAAAPHCRIEVFDPTLPSASRLRLKSLERRGVLRLHEVGLADSRTVGGVSLLQPYRKDGGATPIKARMATLSEIFDRIFGSAAKDGDALRPWVDYLKVDCEGCEERAIPLFLNDSMRRWGLVPVTQLQLEVHIDPRSGSPSAQQQLLRSYSKAGLKMQSAGSLLVNVDRTEKARRKRVFNNPHAYRSERRMRPALALLQAHGFVPFHVDFGDVGSCCSIEYSLLNIKAPVAKLAKLLP